MDVGVITAIVALVGTVVSGGVGYATGRGKDKVTERELLSKDEQSFRSELREELRTYKEEIKRLSDEVTILRKENMELISENRVLDQKVEQLVSQLSRLEGDVRTNE